MEPGASSPYNYHPVYNVSRNLIHVKNLSDSFAVVGLRTMKKDMTILGLIKKKRRKGKCISYLILPVSCPWNVSFVHDTLSRVVLSTV